MTAEKQEKALNVMVRQSMFEQFVDRCNDENRTISEVVRELMAKYIKGWIQQPEVKP